MCTSVPQPKEFMKRNVKNIVILKIESPKWTLLLQIRTVDYRLDRRRKLNAHKTFRMFTFMWRCGITTAHLHSTNPEFMFCAGSNPACGVSHICDDEDLWQWSRLEMRLNAFRRSTIPQKQFIIIRRRGRLLNAFCTFNLRLVSRDNT